MFICNSLYWCILLHLPCSCLYLQESGAVIALPFSVFVLPSVCGQGLRMEQDHQKEIERIIGQLKCPKDFVCYKSEFETLCQVKDIGLKDYDG